MYDYPFSQGTRVGLMVLSIIMLVGGIVGAIVCFSLGVGVAGIMSILFGIILCALCIGILRKNDNEFRGGTSIPKGLPIALAVAAVIGIIVSVIVFSPKKTADAFGHTKEDAWIIAQEKVSEKLKDPSSAFFDSIDKNRFEIKGNTWTVKGNVSALNSWGARRNCYFVVTITFTSQDRYTADCFINQD